MNILCKIFGHKWEFMSRSEMSDEKPDGFLVYECVRCRIVCKEEEDIGEREMW